MKKIVAVIAFFTMLMDGVYAQNELRFGFQVSPTFSWMNTDDNTVNNNGTNLGLKLGLISEYYFRENYAFITGIGFAFNQGGTLLHENGGEIWTRAELPVNRDLPKGTNLKYDLQYVEIPFGLKMRSKEFGYFRYFAEIPTFSIGFKSQARGSIKGNGLEENNIEIKKEVISLFLSWGLGMGGEYSLSASSSLMFGLFYQRVFTDVTRDVAADDSKAVINNITIRFALMF